MILTFYQHHWEVYIANTGVYVFASCNQCDWFCVLTKTLSQDPGSVFYYYGEAF